MSVVAKQRKYPISKRKDKKIRAYPPELAMLRRLHRKLQESLPDLSFNSAVLKSCRKVLEQLENKELTPTDVVDEYDE